MRDRRGFTLVELCAVVICCLLMLAILVPEVVLAGKHAEAAKAAAAGVERDWSKLPAVVEMKDAPVIYAIGDIHGDYEKAVKVLVAAKLLKSAPAKPEDAKWAGGTAVLVCTGDMIDKGPESVEVLEMMRALQADAAANGGRMVVTFGNHEAEFLADDGHGKKAAEFETELKAKGLSGAEVASGRDALGLGARMRGLPAGVKVDDWFFSHAGNTHGETVDKIEKEVEDGVAKDGFKTAALVDADSILEARMHPKPWWDGGKMTGLERLQADAAAVGCRHLVAGHQPGEVKFGDHVERQKDTPYAYEGVLFLEDTGMSRGVDDGKAVVLKIDTGKKEKVRVIDAAGGESLLWEGK